MSSKGQLYTMTQVDLSIMRDRDMIPDIPPLKVLQGSAPLSQHHYLPPVTINEYIVKQKKQKLAIDNVLPPLFP